MSYYRPPSEIDGVVLRQDPEPGDDHDRIPEDAHHEKA